MDANLVDTNAQAQVRIRNLELKLEEAERRIANLGQGGPASPPAHYVGSRTKQEVCIACISSA